MKLVLNKGNICKKIFCVFDSQLNVTKPNLK